MLKPLASLGRAAVTLRVLAVVLLALAGAGMPPPAAEDWCDDRIFRRGGEFPAEGLNDRRGQQG